MKNKLLINFCGDSFCKDIQEPSWCNLVASSLNAKIIGTGEGGTAHEHAIKTFNEKADITIFCWTEYNRIYHKKYSFNFESVQHHLLENKAKSNRAFLAANAYYQYLHGQKLAIERQIRDLFWFDHCVLEKVNKTFLHLFCYENTYIFKNGINTPLILKRDFESTDKTIDSPIHNHLNINENKKLAEQVLHFLKNSC